MNKTQEKFVETAKSIGSRCPDYDEECKGIANHLACFMGGTVVCTDCGRSSKMPIAKGYCPFVQVPN